VAQRHLSKWESALPVLHHIGRLLSAWGIRAALQDDGSPGGGRSYAAQEPATFTKAGPRDARLFQTPVVFSTWPALRAAPPPPPTAPSAPPSGRQTPAAPGTPAVYTQTGLHPSRCCDLYITWAIVVVQSEAVSEQQQLQVQNVGER
jgi:hypothetical protein